MDSKSTWQKDISIKKKFPELKKNLDVDVLIIGGGITGLTSAYLLSKENLKVALIEKDVINANSATAFTTAFISMVADTDLSTLLENLGEEKARQIWKAGLSASDFIEKTIKEEKIDCDFMRVSEYIFSKDKKESESLEKEAATAKKLGFDVHFGHDHILNFPTDSYMEVKNQAKFHPLKYVEKLVQFSSKKNIDFYEKTEALKIDEEDLITVETKSAKITAKYVIMATYSPFNHPIGMYFKGGLYKTYMIEAEIPKGMIREAIYEDSDSPYHYFRVDKFKDYYRIILGGEDHREDIPVSEEKNFKALEDFLKQLLGYKKYKIINRWTGPILEPIDGLPFIGRIKKNSNVLITHGFSGTGMTFGTLSALIFKDIILNRKNEFEDLFKADRLPSVKMLASKGIDYSEEFVGGALKNIINYSHIKTH